MKKKSLKPFIILFALLLILMSIGKQQSTKWRGFTVAFLAPFWESMNDVKLAAGGLFGKALLTQEASPSFSKEEVQALRLENQLLKNELRRLQQHFGDDLGYIFYMDFDLVPAKVIFRSPATWESSLWINVGKVTNAQLGREVVVPNSPVVMGKSVVGVVDYVGEKQSRVRLITDSGLSPSVRAVRNQGNVIHRLAKGELHGSSKPLWRTNGHLLRGVGFNYDFADAHGPARDLRTGKPLDTLAQNQEEIVPLLQVNDLLVTTGLDGVFPPGLQVARITKLFPLKEGDYYYELEAKPTAGNLDEISYMFILKPIGYEPEDRPPPLGW